MNVIFQIARKQSSIFVLSCWKAQVKERGLTSRYLHASMFGTAATARGLADVLPLINARFRERPFEVVWRSALHFAQRHSDPPPMMVMVNRAP